MFCDISAESVWEYLFKTAAVSRATQLLIHLPPKSILTEVAQGFYTMDWQNPPPHLLCLPPDLNCADTHESHINGASTASGLGRRPNVAACVLNELRRWKTMGPLYSP